MSVIIQLFQTVVINATQRLLINEHIVFDSGGIPGAPDVSDGCKIFLITGTLQNEMVVIEFGSRGPAQYNLVLVTLPGK